MVSSVIYFPYLPSLLKMKAKPLKDNGGDIGVVATGTSAAMASTSYSDLTEEISARDSFKMNKNPTYGLCHDTYPRCKSTDPIVTTANQAYGYSKKMVCGAADPATSATIYEDN